MMKIRILTFTLVGMFVFFTTEATNNVPKAICRYYKERGYWASHCFDINGGSLKSVPDNMVPEIELMDLRSNRISELTNGSLDAYPNVKELLLSENGLHTIEPGALAGLAALDVLDASHNGLSETPPDLPASLRVLDVNYNPVKSADSLRRAAGLQELRMRHNALASYPDLGPLPALTAVDVSDSAAIADLDAAQLAGTCRLARLNVTGCGRLFRGGRRADCRCGRVVRWAAAFNIRLVGMPPCPSPSSSSSDCAEDDAAHENAALEAFETCAAEWRRRNAPSRWIVGLGLSVVVVLVLALCVRLARRALCRRRGPAGVDGAARPDGEDAAATVDDDDDDSAAGRLPSTS